MEKYVSILMISILSVVLFFGCSSKNTTQTTGDADASAVDVSDVESDSENQTDTLMARVMDETVVEISKGLDGFSVERLAELLGIGEVNHRLDILESTSAPCTADIRRANNPTEFDQAVENGKKMREKSRVRLEALKSAIHNRKDRKDLTKLRRSKMRRKLKKGKFDVAYKGYSVGKQVGDDRICRVGFYSTEETESLVFDSSWEQLGITLAFDFLKKIENSSGNEGKSMKQKQNDFLNQAPLIDAFGAGNDVHGVAFSAVVELLKREAAINGFAYWLIVENGPVLLLNPLSGNQREVAKTWIRDFYNAANGEQFAAAETEIDTKHAGDSETFFKDEPIQKAYYNVWKSNGSGGDTILLVHRFWLVQLAYLFDMEEASGWAKALQVLVSPDGTLPKNKTDQYYFNVLSKVHMKKMMSEAHKKNVHTD